MTTFKFFKLILRYAARSGETVALPPIMTETEVKILTSSGTIYKYRAGERKFHARPWGWAKKDMLEGDVDLLL